jgi:hypothetical protein
MTDNTAETKEALASISNLIAQARDYIKQATDIADANGIEVELDVGIDKYGLGGLTYYGKGTKVYNNWGDHTSEGEWLSSSDDNC